MSLTFYYAPMSTASVTQAVIAELALPCEKILLNIKAGETRKPEFLKINPNGCVPAIVHDGVTIWESSAITMYLGEVYGVDAKLYPAPGTQRGEAMKCITWSNVTMADAGSCLAAALHTGNKEGAEKARADLEKCLKILDNALAGKSFLLGDYSLVDTHVSSFVGWLTMMEVDLKAVPNVSGWSKRCGQRPAIAKLYS